MSYHAMKWNYYLNVISFGLKISSAGMLYPYDLFIVIEAILDDWQIFKNNLKKDTLVVNLAKFSENWTSGFRREDS